MGLVIGMDEAGYGPNLGPLVVTATVWDVPGAPRRCNFWTPLETVVCRSVSDGDRRLHVADSKHVYTRSRGIESLERSVLSILRFNTGPVRSFRQLRDLLTVPESALDQTEPWFENDDLVLPCRERLESIERLARWLSDCGKREGIRLRNVRSDVVFTRRFNRLTRECESKGTSLSRISLRLLREVWDPHDARSVLILADKHGGRNHYRDLLLEAAEGHMVLCREESRAVSRYHIGTAEICFQTKAEVHFPVAVASMISKYVRELAMMLFNRFWQHQLPGLKPTAGYPADARRFKRDIAEVQARLGIADDVLWRER